MHRWTGLAMLPLATCALPLAAVTVAETDELTINLHVRLQPRAEAAIASDANGNDYDIWDGDGDPEAVDFFMRRARVAVTGSYREDTKFSLWLVDDGLGLRRDGTADGATKSDIRFLYAWVEHNLTLGETAHAIRVGLDTSVSITALRDSTAALLLPTLRPTGQWGQSSSVGLAYRANWGPHRFWAGIQNRDDDNDYLFAARFETSFDDDWVISQLDSYAGREGWGMIFGLDVSYFTDDSSDGTEGVVVIGDFHMHANQLSVSAEVGWRDWTDSTGVEPDDSTGLIAMIQAGWAEPFPGLVVEPAFRVSYVDNDTDENEESVYIGEYPRSGIEAQVGVNLYLPTPNRKLQASYAYWTAEAGDGEAHIFRLQFQFNF